MNYTGKGFKFKPGPECQNYKHGLSGTRVYKSWSNMLTRCRNPKSEDFKNYGGRGIKVCVNLTLNPEEIVRMIGHPPDGHSLNRIDNNGHYSCGICPECTSNGWSANIEWATPKIQSRNRRLKSNISLNGETHCRAEWAEILGIKARTIKGRIQRGRTGDSVLSTRHLQTKKPLDE